MRTKFKISLWQRFRLLSEALNFYIRYRIGSYALYCIRRYEAYQTILADSDYERLSPERMASLLETQRDQVDDSAERRARTEKVTPDKVKAATEHSARLASEAAAVLEGTPLSPVVHVGARVDVVSEYLAKRFPDIDFVSVDLQANLAEHNRFLDQAPNWSFKPGYIIDHLERSEICPKMLMLMFTACKMSPKEFRHFFQLAAPHLNACIILDAYKPNIVPPRMVNPDDIEETPDSD